MIQTERSHNALLSFCQEYQECKAAFKAAFIVFFSHLEARQQAVNTTLTYYHLVKSFR